jgi:hypothetical protein
MRTVRPADRLSIDESDQRDCARLTSIGDTGGGNAVVQATIALEMSSAMDARMSVVMNSQCASLQSCALDQFVGNGNFLVLSPEQNFKTRSGSKASVDLETFVRGRQLEAVD